MLAVALTGAIAVPATPAAWAGAGTGATTGRDSYLSPSGNGGYDVSRYDVTLAYDAATHGIADASVDVRAQATQELRRFSLDARAGLDIRSVRVDGAKARFRHRDDKLLIRGFGTITQGSAFTVTVAYSGRPVPVRDQSGRGTFGWLRTRAGAVTYTEPTGTSTWVPSNDVFYDKATWRMRLSAPKGLTGVSTGRFLGAKKKGGTTVTRWAMDTPLQPYIQVVAFDRFTDSTRPVAGLPAFTAVARNSGVTVRKMQQRTAYALRWLVPRLGPYPFATTGAIVVDGADSAMETAGRPTFSAGSWNTSQATVLHEQAHQWFGNTVTAASARDIWLHEGFATYLENVETAQRTGRQLGDIVHEQYVWDGWGKRWRGQFGRVSLSEPTMRFLLNTTPYYRGQAALHALRLELGDDTFWRVMRGLAQQPVGRNYTTPQIIDLAEQYSGRDLSAWTAQWVESKDLQRLPQAPTHQAVVRQLGPYILDAASDFVWDPHKSVSKVMHTAERGWLPLNQLEITDVATVRHNGTKRYYVDFRTKPGIVYPGDYRTCFVFDRNDDDVLAGSYLGVKFSDDFRRNTFTLGGCPVR
ncbi:MAG: M1 family metallopeptidase [Candidatus Nanopelagicales bacterium]